MKKREYRYEWDILWLKCTKCWEWKDTSSYSHSKWCMFWFHPVCKECIASYKKEWYIKNIDARKQYLKDYYESNKDTIKNRVRLYEKENRDKVYERAKSYRHKNEDKMNQYFKEYYEHNKDEILKRNSVWTADFEERFKFNLWTFHTKTRRYVNKFKLKPIVCPICWSNKNIEIHHPSYSSFDKWCEVVFCCRACHRLIHYGTIECPKPINLLELK